MDTERNNTTPDAGSVSAVYSTVSSPKPRLLAEQYGYRIVLVRGQLALEEARIDSLGGTAWVCIDRVNIPRKLDLETSNDKRIASMLVFALNVALYGDSE